MGQVDFFNSAKTGASTVLRKLGNPGHQNRRKRKPPLEPVMNIRASRTIAIVFAMLCISTIAAAPGNPIGGIIVKGGKNPGGEMRALATTDRNGEFTIEFREGGEYKIAFEFKAGDQRRNQIKDGMQLEYTVKSSGTAAHSMTRQASRTVPSATVLVKIDRATILIAIPTNGATVSGKIQWANPSNVTGSRPH